MRQAAWVRWFAGALCLAALASLYLAVAWWVALLAMLLAGLWWSGPKKRVAPKSVLRTRGWEGGWELECAAERHALALEHVWHAPVWTTLRFSRPSTRKPLYLTVWRSEVSSSGWRQLRQLALRGAKPLSQEAS